MRKISKYWVAMIVIFATTVVLNLVAFSKSFCDWYSVTIYRALNAVIGFLTGWSKVAIGEIIMYIGALLIVLLVVGAIVRLVLFKNQRFKKFYTRYAKTCLAIILVFLLVYTTNWSIPFRGNVLKVEKCTKTTFTNEEVIAVRNMIVTELNETAKIVPRDENGKLITDFTQEELFEALKAKSDEFPKLKGHYSPAKEALCSDELSWMGIGGYNYIYTMEATYNKYTASINMPVTIAHELCHHKGYYLENEATFLSAMALAESGNPFLKYCGLLEMYNYIDWEAQDAYVEAKLADPTLVDEYNVLYEAGLVDISSDDFIEEFGDIDALGFIASQMYYYSDDVPQVDQIVWDDVSQSIDENWELYDEEVNEVMAEATSEAFFEISFTGWEIQGDILKENTYSGMTLMLLQYYVE